MNRFIYSKLFCFPLFLLLLASASYGQVSLVNSGSNTLCAGDSVTLSVADPYSAYAWSTGETTATISVGTDGDYFLVVTDSLNNELFSDTISIDVITIEASASITDLICNGDQDGEVDITVSGGTAPYTFLWSNGSTEEDLTGLSGALYVVTITDSTGCSVEASFNVNEPAVVSITAALTPVNCQGGNNGAIDITVTGGGGSYIYEWSNAETTEDLTGLVAGTYTVTATDNNGCAATDFYEILDGLPLDTPVISGSNLVCQGSFTILDAGSGYDTYEWSNAETTQTVSVGTGTYSVTVSNLAGCSANSGNFEVTESTPPTVSILASGPVQFCDGGSVTLTATAGFSSYSWSSGETIDNITTSDSGIYTVTVTDVNSCTATATIEVTVYPTPYLDIITLSDVLCKDDANGVIEVEGNGGTAPYLYDVNNDGFSSNSSFTGLTQGVYDITVQDAHGCTSMTQFFISEPDDYLSASYATLDVLCYGDATGEIDLTVTGGTEPYTYEWSNAATTEDLTGLVAGVYTVTVTDANGCQMIFAIDIFEPSQIVVGQDFTNISCFGGSDGTAIVFVSGGVPDYTYSWDTNPVQTDFVAFNLDAGLHSVTITDANGCVVVSAFLISEPPQLDATSLVTDVTCFGYANGSATVSGSGGTPYLAGEPYLYSWNTIPVQTTQTATGLAVGSYTVSITDSTGCIKYVIISVDEPNQLMVSTSDINVNCNGGNNGESNAIVSGGTPPYLYSWNTVPVQTGQTATGLTGGTYTVTVTDLNGCSASVNVLITEPLPILLPGTITHVTCHGGSDGQVLLNVSGGTAPYTYFWNTAPAQTNANLQNVIAGSYTVIVTDHHGCTGSATFVVSEPAQINTNETVTNVTCHGGNNGSILLNVTGGIVPYVYIWSNGNTTASVTGLSAGSYTVTVTDANICAITRTIVVSQPADIAVLASVSNVSCHGGANGSVSLTVAGGTAPYSYLWSTGETTSQVSGLSAATYTVTITDGAGCTKTAGINVTQPAVLGCVCNSNTTNVSCFGGSNGSITVTPTGGTPPYSYLWSNGQVTQTANGLVAGTYTVTITDANGCQATGVITVTEPQLLFVFATSTNISCNGAQNGSANAIVVGGTPPYSYSWNSVPVQTTQAATGLQPGTYTITVTDAKGCTANSTATITQPAALNCSTSSTNITCNGSTNGTATVVASGGAPPYTYLWNTIPAKTTTTVIGLGSGTYTVTITDSQGCTKTCQATVSQPSSLVALYVPSNVLCNGSSTGAIDLTVTGGTAPYTYNWSNGATTQDLTGLAAGIYTITVTDHKGCNISAIITITQPPVLACSASSTNVSCFGGANGTATVSVNGGIAPYHYLWSNGNTTSAVSGLAIGSYTVTVSDNNSCTTICSVTITEPPVLSCSIHTCCDTILCYGEISGGLDVLVSGGSPPYFYAWNTIPVQTSAVASGLGAGSYSVTVTDSKGCTTTCTYILTQPDVLSCNTIGSNVSCHGGSDGTAMVFVTGGTQPYAYVWNTLVAQTTSTATGLSAGTYTVFVTDANGCTTSCSVIITQPASISLSISSVNISCFGAHDGSATVTGSGGMMPYAYLWSNGETTASITGLGTGSYTVTVTDGGGCSATASATITEPPVINCSVSVTNVSCFGGNNGTATVTASGGTGTLSYSWNTVPIQVTVTATGLDAGTYTVTVTDVNGCTTTCSGSITEPDQLGCSVSLLSNVTCHGGSDGSAVVTATGGTPPYTYAWNTAPVQTTDTATGLEAGDYSVTVTDFNGCSSTCTIKIEQPDQLTCNTSPTETSCGNDDGQATVTPSGGVAPYVYLWSDGQTTATATGLAAGDYTVTVTDASNCTTSCQANVGASSNLIAIITGVNISCYGNTDGMAIVAAAGGEPPYTYLWNTIPAQTTDTANGLGAGTYTVLVSDTKGCTISKTITLTEPDELICQVNGNNFACAGQSVQLCAEAGMQSYQWSTGATTQCISVNQSGTYTVTITNSNGCTSSCDKVVTISPPVVVQITGDTAICSGGSTQLCATAGFSGYLWSTGATTQCITASSQGIYTVTVTNADGCTGTATANVLQSNTMSCTVTGNNPACFGGNNGSASVQVIGGTAPYSYLWSNGQTTATATGLVAGTYTVTVTDVLGCITSCNTTIANPAIVLVNVVKVKDVSCFGGSDASAEANPSGGTSPYTYAWSNGATTKIISGVPAGTYTVTVTDASGCTATGSVTLTQPTEISITITKTNVTCNGAANGTASASVTGGTPPYSYSWNTVPVKTTSSVTGLAAGTYILTVTDANGCVKTKSVTISQPPAIVISFTKVVNISCFGGSNGTVEANPSGGTPPYSYLWSNGQTVQFITGLTAGTYTVTVTDANGCTKTKSLSLTQPPVLNCSISKTDAGCNVNNGSATVTPSGGTAPYTYLWNTSPAKTTATITGLAPGTYSVTVTDAKGCTSVCQVTILQSSGNISIAFTKVEHVACFGGSNGTVEANPSGGTSPYSYLWSNGQTVQFITGLTAGTYTVTVTDANGCTKTKSLSITQPPALSCSIAKTDAGCNVNNGSATVTPSGGTAPYTYLWNTSPAKTTTTVTGLAPGTYSVTVTDAHGCTSVCQVTITQLSGNISIAFTKVEHVACFGGSNGTVEANPSGGTSPYSYLWSNGQTVQFITGLTAGTYTVTVTDANGCTKTKSLSITQPPALSCSIAKTDAGCNVNNGSATVTPSGGTAPYTYLWNTSPAKTTAAVTGLAPGTYSVTVTDAHGCTSVCQVTITQLTGNISIAFTKVEHVACFGGSNGTVEANPSGGTSPYSYLWSNGQTVQFITGLTAGTYTVTVTDANGCTKTKSLSITQPPALSCSIAKTDAGCNGNNGSATVTASGGTAPYVYLWNTSPAKTTATVTGLAPGTYGVTITDAHGCTSVCQVTILQASGISIAFTKVVHVACNGGSNGTAEANPSGGTSPYSYLWSNGKTTAFITGLAAGTYTVTVTDNLACTKTGSVAITQPSKLQVTSTQVNVSCNGGNNGSINITASGGTPPYAYQWNNGSTSEDRSNLHSGSYTVTVTDAKGCKKTVTFCISDPSPICVNITTNSNVSCNGGSNGKLTASASGGTAPYTYLWNTVPAKTTASVSGLTAGTYTVTVTDNKGCVKTASKTVTQPSVLTINISKTNVTNNGGSNGTATASPSGGTSPYTYSWNTVPVKTTQTITGLVAGTYTVTVTDHKGCTKSAAVTITQPVACQSFKSYTKTGWAVAPSGTNAGAYLNNNFAAAFPSGLIIGDCSRQIKLTTASAVRNFLPTSGTSRRLNAGLLTNPTSSAYGNTLAGQLVALKLNITFDNYDAAFAPSSSTHFNELLIASGPFMGWTVQQLYDEANNKIGCGGVSSSYFSSLNSAISDVNQSWSNGISCNGILVCPGTPLRPGVIDYSDEAPKPLDLKIYPNPTNGAVNLQFNIEEEGAYELQVIDLAGRVVYTESSRTEAGFNGKYYDFTNLPKGVYVFRITINGYIQINRTIIQ